MISLANQLLSPLQYGLTAVHIICKKGNLNMLKKLLTKAKGQRVCCSKKGKSSLSSDCEAVLLTRAKKVMVHRTITNLCKIANEVKASVYMLVLHVCRAGIQ